MSNYILLKSGTKVDVTGLTPQQVESVRSTGEDNGNYGGKAAALANTYRTQNAAKTTAPTQPPLTLAQVRANNDAAFTANQQQRAAAPTSGGGGSPGSQPINTNGQPTGALPSGGGAGGGTNNNGVPDLSGAPPAVGNFVNGINQTAQDAFLGAGQPPAVSAPTTPTPMVSNPGTPIGMTANPNGTVTTTNALPPTDSTPVSQPVTTTNPVSSTGAVDPVAATTSTQDLSADAAKKNFELNNPNLQTDVHGNTRNTTLNADGTVTINDTAGSEGKAAQGAFLGAVSHIGDGRNAANAADYGYITRDYGNQKTQEVNAAKQELAQRGIPLDPDPNSLYGRTLAQIDSKYQTLDDQAHQQAIIAGDNTYKTDVGGVQTLAGVSTGFDPKFAAFTGATYDNNAQFYTQFVGMDTNQIMTQLGLDEQHRQYADQIKAAADAVDANNKAAMARQKEADAAALKLKQTPGATSGGNSSSGSNSSGGDTLVNG